MITSKIFVREAAASDLPHLMDYWFSLNEEALKNMGADIHKLPDRNEFHSRLENQLTLPRRERKSYLLVAESEGKLIGHCNLNPITSDNRANMHLHIWKPEHRKNGIGSEMVKRSLPYFFHNIGLKELVCEPFAENPAPNKTLKKLGFTYIKRYTTIPGSINFEQEVNQWKLDRSDFLAKLPELNSSPWAFETERLFMRPVYHIDAAFFLKLVNSPKWITNIGQRHVYTIEKAQDYIEEKMMSQLRTMGFANYLLIRKEDGQKLGVSGIYSREGLSECDLGFALLPEFERKGYAHEGSKKIMELAFDWLKMSALSAITIPKNLPSRQLLEKLGFEFQKIIKLSDDSEDLMLYRATNNNLPSS